MLHTTTLNTMRKYTDKTKLVRNGITCSQSTSSQCKGCINIKATYETMDRMCTSDDWSILSVSKAPKRQNARDIILMPFFWNDMLYNLKLIEPLVHVPKLVDDEKILPWVTSMRLWIGPT